MGFKIDKSTVTARTRALKAGYSIENMSAPRALFDELPDFGKRAVWCHQNCWESISIHAPACLLCLITSPDSIPWLKVI